MESFTAYWIHPYLHSNKIKFMGVENFGEFIYQKIQGQHIYRLSNDGCLASWNILTAKFNM